jgi:hypothetical protein
VHVLKHRFVVVGDCKGVTVVDKEVVVETWVLKVMNCGC